MSITTEGRWAQRRALMKTMVIYDSVYGNTEKIAEAIAGGMGRGTKARRPSAVGADELSGVDLLVIGSPTLGGRPTKAIQGFIDSIPKVVAGKLTIAAFDKRMSMKFAKIFGYAAARIAAKLQVSGCTLKSPAVGFIVRGSSGPLAEGELERATAWGRGLSTP
jgi:flavodoxin